MTRDDLLKQLQGEFGADWGDGNVIALPKGSIQRVIHDALDASLPPKEVLTYGFQILRSATSVTWALILRRQLLLFHAAWETRDDHSPDSVAINQRFIPTAGLVGTLEATAGGPGLAIETATLKLLAPSGDQVVLLTGRARTAIHVQKFMAALSSTL